VIVVTGVSGQLGTAFRRQIGSNATYLTRADLDLAEPDSIRPVIEGIRPTVVINCAAYTAVDRAEEDAEVARAVNAVAVGELAAVTRDVGARLVTFSTDYVFDGTKAGAYTEDDEPNPLNVYGRTKLEGEGLAVAANPGVVVIRTSWVLSGTHSNFAATMLRLMSEGTVNVVDDQRGHPTLVDDLATATLAVLETDASGLLHLTNAGTTTWFGLAREVAEIAGIDVDRVQPITTEEYPLPAERPANSVLESVRLEELELTPLPHYRDRLERAVAELRSPR
jgi:dTDP-4-dehydrorhamnose reductase